MSFQESFWINVNRDCSLSLGVCVCVCVYMYDSFPLTLLVLPPSISVLIRHVHSATISHAQNYTCLPVHTHTDIHTNTRTPIRIYQQRHTHTTTQLPYTIIIIQISSTCTHNINVSLHPAMAWCSVWVLPSQFVGLYGC